MAQQDYPALLWSLIQEVRDWSNRDSEALSDATIARCLEYSADTAYRNLMIPPLEHTAYYTLQASDFIEGNEAVRGTYVTLDVPADLIQYISIRVRNRGIVFNEKDDERTFFDRYADKKSSNRFARLGNRTHITGDMSEGDVIELRYYRRLAALDARYQVNVYNVANASVFLTQVTTGDAQVVDGQLVTPTQVTNNGNTEYYVGKQVPNWLRDDNRKCLVFGALYHAFDFLADPMSDRWAQKFALSMEELNKEEKMRRASGGNVQVNFSSNLI